MTGLIASAIITVGISVFFPDRLTLSVCKTPAFYASLLIFLISYFLSRKKLHPILIILIRGLIAAFE